MTERHGEPPSVQRPPPGAWEPMRRAASAIARPLERFLAIQAASGILLLICAVAAMVWANVDHHGYHHFWEQTVTIGFESALMRKSLHFWINDGLMVIFFFVVGLEIRREIHGGELSELRRASLPLAAALGGMLVPAGLYMAMNAGGPGAGGWGVPMATDIAFAVGILALLGNRVPAALRVLLLALAVIDDIGAILVIAVFYSGALDYSGFALAGGGIFLVLGMQWIAIRTPWLYVLPGVVVWYGIYTAGVHPTIAGVVLGLMTPATSWYGERGFLEEAGDALDEFREKASASHDTHDMLHPLQRLEQARREAVPPVVRLVAGLNPYVAFGIMPLFALANAGVYLGDVSLEGTGATAVAAGVAVGLAVGKPLGITGASLLAVKLGLSTFPRGVDWKGVLLVGCVGGVGFTMALFIAQLAYTEGAGAGLLSVAKLAILVGSGVAGVAGLTLGAATLPASPQKGVALTVDEAERSTEL